MKRKRIFGTAFLFLSLVAALICYPPLAGSQPGDLLNKAPRFKLTALKHVSGQRQLGKVRDAL